MAVANRRGGRRRQRGFALIFVLWVMALVTVMAGTYAYSKRLEAAGARNELDSAAARYLAEAGVKRALYALGDPDPQQRWPADGKEQLWSMGDARLWIAIQDTTGLIDINRADLAIIDGILEVVGVEANRRRQITDAVGDWRDRDSVRRANGAEDGDYAAAGSAHGAKDGRFDDVSELGLLPGMTARDVRMLEEFLTVYGGGRDVNPAVAPKSVLLALEKSGLGSAVARPGARDARTTGAAAAGSPGRRSYRISVAVELASGARYGLRAVLRMSGGRAPQAAVLSWDEGL